MDGWIDGTHRERVVTQSYCGRPGADYPREQACARGWEYDPPPLTRGGCIGSSGSPAVRAKLVKLAKGFLRKLEDGVWV